MAALYAYANVESTAIELLRTKGFQVWKDDAAMIWAERDGWDFVADSACALLGAVAIYESIRPTEFRQYWWRLHQEPIELPRDPQPYRAVYERG